MGSRFLRWGLAGALCCLLSSCGTLGSRMVGDDYVDGEWPIGGLPLAALAWDWEVLTEPNDHTAPSQPFVVLTLPLDLVFDVALAPIDLLAWAFGAEKHDLRRENAYAEQHRKEPVEPVPQLWVPSTQRTSK